MDLEKLAKLRAKYGDVESGQIFDPKFRKVREGQRKIGAKGLPYGEVGTLLGAPYRPAHTGDTFEDLDVALVAVPLDLGVTNRAGTRAGPRALRSLERTGIYEYVLDAVPLADARVADVGDVPFRSRYDLESCHEDIQAFYEKLMRANVAAVSVGGDHSMSGSILAAVAQDRPVGLLHIDAHCDTSDPFEDTNFHHGAPFRRAVLEGWVDPDRTVQIGIRGASEFIWEFSYESGMTVIHAEDVERQGVDQVIKTARKILGDGPVYVSFDVDSLDPAFAPGTGTPEVGGLTPREVLAILRGMDGLDVIGGDVVEIAPQYDATTTTAQCAAQMAMVILSLVTKTLQRKAAGKG